MTLSEFQNKPLLREKKQVLVGGLISTYYVQGEGLPLLLLHGWGCSANTFKQLQNDLSKNFKVFAVDFPGFGESEEPKDDWGCVEYANWADKMIEKMQINSPIVLCHSFGGRIALVLHTLQNFNKLIITGGAGLLLKERKENTSAHTIKHFLKKLLPEKTYSRINEAYINKKGSEDYKNASPRMREVLKRVVSEDLKEYAEKINAPTLLIWGESDMDTPIEIGNKLNEIVKGSKLVIVKDAGHYVFLDKKDEFLNHVFKFLGLCFILSPFTLQYLCV